MTTLIDMPTLANTKNNLYIDKTYSVINSESIYHSKSVFNLRTSKKKEEGKDVKTCSLN